MGQLSSHILRWRETETVDPEPPEEQAGPSYICGSRKRKQGSGPSLGPMSEIRRSLSQGTNLHKVSNTCYGKKAKIISNYAYRRLFLNGETSDIKIRALGKVWCLHKMFLQQSAYFANIIRDYWEESQNDIIELDICDQNIDVQSLHFVLGSLYRDEYISIEPLQIPGVLAVAYLLQLEDLIQQCDETMKETISVKTVCRYYAAAETYGLDSVKKNCFEWLLHNLMTHPSVELYKEIDIELMNLLISSPNLLVMQKEMDIYTTLKEWVFLRFNPTWKGSLKHLLVTANDWLSKYSEQVDNITFLETNEGIIFQPVFKTLRFQHIICDLAAAKVIERDNLIPSEWLSTVYKQKWLSFLRAQQCREIGPQHINKAELEGYSMRCGKRIFKDGRYSWKWSGYNFGFPLHVIFTSHYIIFKQNTFRQLCEGSACTQCIRNIAFRLTLAYFDSSGNLSFSKTTGYKILTFEKDEEQVVMNLDGVVLNFPLYIFCNFLFMSSENTRN